MKPAGTSCNIPIGQNLPTCQRVRGNNIVLARPWPDDLVQCRSSCAGGGISACCSTPQPTGPRILVRPALVVECRIAARTAMVSRPPPRLPTAQCPRKATANTCHQIPSPFPSITPTPPTPLAPKPLPVSGPLIQKPAIKYHCRQEQ